jgi:O-methyltransferase involved in polyketide biosynthesis
VDSEAPSRAWRKGLGGWQGAQTYFETTGINITATAGSIAAYRSAVTLCNNTYLDDPFAALFARETCPERFNEILSLPPPKLARFAVRTKFFDNFIRDGVHRRGIKQVLLPPSLCGSVFTQS